MTTEDLNPKGYGYCPSADCGRWIIMRDRDPAGSSVCSMGHYTPTREVHAEPLVRRAREAKLEAERQALRDEGAAAERAAVLGALRGQLAYAARQGWPEAVEMLEECIEDIEAGAHVRPVEPA